MADRPLLERLGLRAHRSLYLRTGGRLGARLRGASLLVLCTTGRRSGERRAVVLVYIQDGPHLVVTATNRGRDFEPEWLLNLLAEPQVTVQLGRRVVPARGVLVEPDEPGFTVLWQRFDEQLHGWLERYQQQTARTIRFVRLLPGC